MEVCECECEFCNSSKVTITHKKIECLLNCNSNSIDEFEKKIMKG